MPSELIRCGPYPRRRTPALATALRALPVLAAALPAAGYLLAGPRSPDLAAQLLRAQLFGSEGLGGVWNNWWYAGHALPGYSVLFPPLAWLLTPQLAGAIGAVTAAALFDQLARTVWREPTWLASTWFAAGTATELLSGRLTFVLGLAWALAATLALARGRRGLAVAAALLTGLTSPVAAVFAALAGAAATVSPGLTGTGFAVAVASLAPVLATALVFGGSGGVEPFGLSALLPIPLIAAGLLVADARRPGRDGPPHRALRAGIVLYAAGCLLDYAIPNPLGGNAARLAALTAGPLAALLLGARRAPARRALLLAIAAPALVYLQWQGAVRDVLAAQTDPSTTAAYYRPLLAFLHDQTGPPFRVEVPFTRDHWEAYELADAGIALARGWERQLDTADDPFFYGPSGRLTATAYDGWLHRLSVRFVALPDAPLDYSSRREAALIRQGQPYLETLESTGHWRIYAVRDPTPIATGAARLIAIGADWLSLDARGPGTTLIRVRYSPLWHGGRLTRAGDFIRLRASRPGEIRLSNGW